MENSEISIETLKAECSEKEAVFAGAFIRNLDKTYAAKIAGHKGTSAAQVGHEMYNRPHVKAYITALLKECLMTDTELLKLINDSSKASLGDYYRPVKRWISGPVKKPLQKIIDGLYKDLRIELRFAKRDITPRQLTFSEQRQNELSSEIIRLEEELDVDPHAYRIVTEEVLTEYLELDMKLLLADKEKAKIKSIKHTAHGVQVELVDPSTSWEKLAKIHGSYEKDNRQKQPLVNLLNLDPLSNIDDSANNSASEDSGVTEKD